MLVDMVMEAVVTDMAIIMAITAAIDITNTNN
jgi:hypothetical protein